MYPADERTRRGIASGELLRGVVGRLADAGWRPVSVDVTIIAGRPRIAEHMARMRTAIAEVLGVAPEAVGIKASTGNLSGDAGAGRAIEAHALATVIRADPSG